MSEFAPSWSNPKMTKAQVRKYIRDLEEAREKARLKIEKAQNSWELDKEKKELENLEKELDNL